MNFIDPGYFDTLGVPRLEAVIAATPRAEYRASRHRQSEFAKAYFQGKRPLGQPHRMGGDPGTKTDIEIIGMVPRYQVRKFEPRCNEESPSISGRWSSHSA